VTKGLFFALVGNDDDLLLGRENGGKWSEKMNNWRQMVSLYATP
jgi:hypothetical protein